jgi:hypothetical protein
VSDPNKSFFSGLHGAVTGFAAFVTSIVAVVGLALNQGWIGGGSGHAKSGAAATATTLPGDTTTSVSTLPGTGSSSASSDSVPSFAVNPSTVVFPPIGSRDLLVSVKNTGLVSMFVLTPTISGPDKARFVATDVDCTTGSVDPGRSCNVKVTFLAATGNFNASVVVNVVGALQAVEVPIRASAIL